MRWRSRLVRDRVAAVLEVRAFRGRKTRFLRRQSRHLLAEIEQVADHVGVMQGGRLAVQDEVRTLLGGESSVCITLDDAVRGVALLRAAGHDAVTDGSVLRLCGAPGDAPARIASANRLLVEAGLQVSAIIPQARSLEDVYREIVERAAA